MYDANSQNTQLRLRTELSQCSYNPNMKDYLANMIMQIMNFPKKTNQARHFIRNMNQDKIIMVWYPMSVPFANKNSFKSHFVYGEGTLQTNFKKLNEEFRHLRNLYKFFAIILL